jgi:hypothetical protein
MGLFYLKGAASENGSLGLGIKCHWKDYGNGEITRYIFRRIHTPLITQLKEANK